MEKISLMKALNLIDKESYFDLFKEFLGYDSKLKLYKPDADVELLSNKIASEKKVAFDDDFIDFLTITNGMEGPFFKFFSFRNLDNNKEDLLYVNLDPTYRKTLDIPNTAVVIGTFGSDYICFDYAKVIDNNNEEGTKVAIYDHEDKSYYLKFSSFYDLLTYFKDVLMNADE